MKKECKTCNFSPNEQFNCYTTHHGRYMECESYSKWEPMIKPTYKLTEKYRKGFSLVDIAKAVKKDKNRCADASFLDLYLDGEHNNNKKYSLSAWIISHKTIKNNLPWLVEKGFICEDAYLKPCPKCKRDIGQGNKNDPHIIAEPCANSHYVFCDYCGLRTKDHSTLDEAIEDWNRRTI